MGSPFCSGGPRQSWSSCFCWQVLLVPDQACIKEETVINGCIYEYLWSTSNTLLQFASQQLGYEKTFIVQYSHIVRSPAAGRHACLSRRVLLFLMNPGQRPYLSPGLSLNPQGNSPTPPGIPQAWLCTPPSPPPLAQSFWAGAKSRSRHRERLKGQRSSTSHQIPPLSNLSHEINPHSDRSLRLKPRTPFYLHLPGTCHTSVTCPKSHVSCHQSPPHAGFYSLQLNDSHSFSSFLGFVQHAGESAQSFHWGHSNPKKDERAAERNKGQ